MSPAQRGGGPAPGPLWGPTAGGKPCSLPISIQYLIKYFLRLQGAGRTSPCRCPIRRSLAVLPEDSAKGRHAQGAPSRAAASIPGTVPGGCASAVLQVSDMPCGPQNAKRAGAGKPPPKYCLPSGDAAATRSGRWAGQRPPTYLPPNPPPAAGSCRQREASLCIPYNHWVEHAPHLQRACNS